MRTRTRQRRRLHADHVLEVLETRALLSASPTLGSQNGVDADVVGPTESAETWVDVANDLAPWTATGGSTIALTPTGFPVPASSGATASASTYTSLIAYPDTPAASAASTFTDSLGNHYYTLSYTGTATVSASAQGSVVGTPTTSTSGGVTTTTYQIAINHAVAGKVTLTFNGLTASNPIGNLHFWMPGYGPGTTGGTSAIFTPGFLHRMSVFNDIRFLKWEDIPRSISNWTGRVVPGDFLGSFATQAALPTVPYEDIIALANTLNTNVWINIPDQATDAYVTQLATLFQQTLNPGLTIRFEYANEVWDGASPVEARVFANAKLNPLITTVDPNLPSATVSKNADQEAYMLLHDAAIFKQVYANAGVSPQTIQQELQPILGGWTAIPEFLTESLRFMSTVVLPAMGAPAGATVNQYISGVATTAYAAIRQPDEAIGWSPAQYVSYLNNYIDTNLSPRFRANAAQAQLYGVPYLAYEAGQDLINYNTVLKIDTNVQAKGFLENQAAMVQIIDHLVNTWQADGGQDMVFYAFVEEPTDFGYAGQLNAMTDAGSIKWNTLLSMIQAPGTITLDKQASFADFQALEANFLAGQWWEQGDFLGNGLADWGDALALEPLLTNLTPDQQAAVATFNASVQAFNFGPSSSTAVPGWTSVSDQTAYSAAQGYGWLPTSTGLASQDYSATTGVSPGTDVNQDVVTATDGLFRVDLPANGLYRVGLRLGDPGTAGHAQIGIYFNSTLVDTVTTQPGQTLNLGYPVQIGNKQLTIELKPLGPGGQVASLAALEVAASTNNTPAIAAPKLKPGGPYTLPADGSVTLAASATDASGFPLYIDWGVTGDGQLGQILNATPLLTYSRLVGLGLQLPSGTIPITARADDGHGHVVTATVNLTIQPVLGPALAGVNVSQIYPVESAETWVDAASDFSGWQPPTPNLNPPGGSVGGGGGGGGGGGSGIAVNAAGYPLQDAGTFTYLNSYPDGVYTLSYTGTATASVYGIGTIVGGPATTSMGGVTTTTIQVQITHQQPAIPLFVSFTGTDPNNPIGNLHLWMPGYGPGTAGGTSAIFTPAFLQKMATFADIRFMDWTTPQGPIVNWSSRPVPGDFLASFTDPADGGKTPVPYEYMIALANTLNKNMWINIPASASSDYITQLAHLLHGDVPGVPGVNPNLTIRIEYSNEAWSQSNPAYNVALAAAATNPLISPTEPALMQVADQVACDIAQISSIFKGVFSDRPSQVAPIFAGWAARSDYLTEGLSFLKKNFAGNDAAQVKNIISGIAIAPYASIHAPDEVAGWTPQQIFNYLNNFVYQTLGPRIADHATLATQYGVPLLAYEAGQELVPFNGTFNTVMNADAKAFAQQSALMTQLYRNLVATWMVNGGREFDFYQFTRLGNSSGDFGLLETENTPGSPKWDAALAMIYPVGDIDLNGQVNFADFQAFESQFLVGRWWQQGNFSGSGVTDWQDALLLEHALTGLTTAQQQAVTAFNASVKAFEFAPATAPAAASWTAVSDQTMYSAAQGYGWLPGATLTSTYYGTGLAPDNAAVYTPNGTFAVDLPNGSYRVELRLGDPGTTGYGPVAVYLNGTLVDTITTTKGQILSLAYPVQITGGQLDVTLQGTNPLSPLAAIASLTVAPSADTTPADQAETISAGGPYSINPYQTIPIAATTSDPQNYPVFVTWDINGDGTFGDVVGSSGSLSYGQLRKLGINVLTAGTITITAQATDGHGHIVTSTTLLTIAPPPLGISFQITNASPNEGDNATGFGYFNDPNLGATPSATVDYGDGNGPQPLAISFDGSFSLKDAYLHWGTYTVTVAGTDDSGTGYTTSATQQVVVQNVAPSPAFVAATPTTNNEGQPVTVSGKIVDPGTLDSHTVTIAWGDGNSTTLSEGPGVTSYSASYAYAVEGTLPITVTVTDDGGLSAVSTTSVNVLHVGPTVRAVTLNQGLLGTDTPTVTGQFLSPGVLDTHTVTVSGGGGSTESISLGANVLNFGPASYPMSPPNGALTVTVTDEENFSNTVKLPVFKTLTTSPTAIVEGGKVVLSGTFSLAGIPGPSTLMIVWGDTTTTTLAVTASATSFSTSHVYLDDFQGNNGLGAVSVTLTNPNSSRVLTTAEVALTVGNVPPVFTSKPTLTLVGTTTHSTSALAVNEGATLALSGAFTDAGALDTHTVTVVWGDGVTDTFSLAAGVKALPADTHIYEYAATPYTVRVIVTDEDGAAVESDLTVTAKGVAPHATFVAAPPALASTFQPISLVVAATSPVAQVTAAGFVYTVSWGDGSSQTFGTSAQPVVGNLALSHTYATAGNHIISIQATDRDGFKSTPLTATVAVMPVTVQTDPLNASGAMLVVGGVTGNVTVTVLPSATAGALNVKVSNAIKTYSPPAGESFTRIVLEGGPGNDLLQIDPALTLPALILAGTGNDTLKAGSGPTVLVGGGGHDSLVAGPGDDILIAGTGASTLVGGAGNDILIGGTTAFNANILALSSLLAEWSRTDIAPSARMADLNGTTSGGLNGPYYLTAATVIDNQAVDTLLALVPSPGNARGMDWFLADLSGDANQDNVENEEAQDVETSIV
jgi:hypothetical protein